MATLQVTDHFTLQFDSVIIKQMFDLLPESDRQDVINHVTDQATGKEIYNCLKLSQMIEVDKLIKQSRLIND